MDIIWSLGLVIVLLVALSRMAGGRASSVLKPATAIVTRLLSSIVRATLSLIGSVFRLSVGSIEFPKLKAKKETERQGTPPPRWKG